MKKSKIVFLTLMVSLSSMKATSVYAGVENCPPGVVHCAYFSGLSNNLDDGRYIKISNNIIGNITVCFNGTSTISIGELSAPDFLGNNTDAYSICSDNSGNNCEQVGVDNFVISKNNNSYSAEPQFFDLDLSVLKNKYPACDASNSTKISQHRSKR